MWLIGGDDNFVGQILMVLKVKKHKERKKKENVQQDGLRMNRGARKGTGDGVKN